VDRHEEGSTSPSPAILERILRDQPFFAFISLPSSASAIANHMTPTVFHLPILSAKSLNELTVVRNDDDAAFEGFDGICQSCQGFSVGLWAVAGLAGMPVRACRR
jgi:hypothetical protein